VRKIHPTARQDSEARQKEILGALHGHIYTARGAYRQVLASRSLPSVDDFDKQIVYYSINIKIMQVVIRKNKSHEFS
jgi:hypothetical protein